ncbi:MAG: menaquinone biosynthetic enzyme MqnA/MqnD family protein [Thermodesulfobacteriota bacterium]
MNPFKLKMGKINYINAFPVYYGIDQDENLLPDWIDLIAEPPSDLNRRLVKGEIQISPISSAFYGMHHEELLLLPDLSISCHGKVMSVVLMSRYPIEDLDGKTVILTQESETSAAFVKMILLERDIHPVFETRRVKKLPDVKNSADAVLVIGDTALKEPWESVFDFRIDLGDMWYEMTGMPFVFAVWAVRRTFAQKKPEIVNKVIDLLLESKRQGDGHMNQIIRRGADTLGLKESYIKEYYDCLFCDFDIRKIEALECFFRFLHTQGIFEEEVKAGFFERK